MNKSQLSYSHSQQFLKDHQVDVQDASIHSIIKLVLVEFFRSFTRPLKVTSLPSHLEKTLEHAAQDYYLPGYTTPQHQDNKAKPQP